MPLTPGRVDARGSATELKEMADNNLNEKNPVHIAANKNNQLRYILDHVGAYVFTKDHVGRYTFANAMVCELFGRPLEEIIGKTDEYFFDLSISAELLKSDNEVLQLGRKVEREERNIIAKTGEERIYWSVKIPTFNEEGSIHGLCGISTDITERRRLEQKLEEKNTLLEAVLENMDAYVYMKDRNRRYMYVNGKTADLYKLSLNNIVGKLDEEILPKETAERFALLDKQVIEGEAKSAGEETVKGSTGEEKHYWSIKIPLFKKNEVGALIGISTDISEVVKLKNKFHELASIDMLTGVLTRRFFLEHAEVDLKRSNRNGGSLGLLLIDVDKFKGINDKYGHAFGDTYLAKLANIWKGALREGDLIGRLGGDEFAVVIANTDIEGLKSTADRLQQAVRSTVVIAPDGKALALSISMGGSLSLPSSTLDRLMATADGALYKAKKLGRDTWQIDS